MNPLAIYIGSIVRTLLIVLFSEAAHRGWVTQDQATNAAIYVAGVLVVLGWSLVQKYFHREKLIVLAQYIRRIQPAVANTAAALNLKGQPK